MYIYMYLFGNLNKKNKKILPMSRFLLPPAPQLRLKVGGADIHRAISRHCGHQTGTRGGRFGCHLFTQGAPRAQGWVAILVVRPKNPVGLQSSTQITGIYMNILY